MTKTVIWRQWIEKTIELLPSLGYIQKTSDSTSYLLDDVKDSGAKNTSGNIIDFETKCSFLGRFILDNPSTSEQFTYHIGTNTKSYKGMMPAHGIDVYQQIGSEESFRCDVTISPARQSGPNTTLSKDSHVQYWRLSWLLFQK